MLSDRKERKKIKESSSSCISTSLICHNALTRLPFKKHTQKSGKKPTTTTTESVKVKIIIRKRKKKYKELK